MIKYYQYEDLHKQGITKEKGEGKKTNYIYKEFYWVPPSGTMPKGSRRRSLIKYDWIDEVKTPNAEDGQAMEIHLNVLRHKDKETGKKLYDIDTFEGDFSDRLLYECYKVYLDFNVATDTKIRNHRFAMTNCGNEKIADMLENFAKRTGRMIRKKYETIPQHLWILCIPYKSTTSDVLMMVCLDCDTEEKTVYEIFLVNDYKEFATQLRESAPSKGIPHPCLNYDMELYEALRDKQLVFKATRDLQQIPLFINKALTNPDIFRKEDQWVLEDCRDKMCYWLQKLCSVDFSSKDQQNVKKNLQNVLKKFSSMTFEKDTQKRLGRRTKEEILEACGRVRNSNREVEDYIERGKPFHSMEAYRFLYLLNKYQKNRPNISAERMRLQLLCSYISTNCHLHLKKNWATTSNLGIGKCTLSMLNRFDVLDLNAPKWIKRTKIMFGDCEKVYHIRNFRRFKRIKAAKINGKIILPHIEYCHSYYLKLKIVPSPKLKQRPVALGDMIKRLETLMGLI